MDYLWLKALHITAVMVWVGGMLLVAVTIIGEGAKPGGGATDRSAMLDSVRHWDRRVTAPAMLLVWALGLTLALQGGWFPAPWLIAKLVLVLGLSAVHGLLSGTLRRQGHVNAHSAPTRLTLGPAAIIMTCLAIVTLVVVKPV